MSMKDRVAMTIARGVISAVDDAPTMQSVQIELLAEEVHDEVEHMQPYGLAAHPHPDAEALAVAVGGNRSHLVVLAVGDRRYRLRGLAAGEVALYDDLGQVVHLTRAGIVIRSAEGISIETEGDLSLSAEGDVVIAGSSVLVDSDDVTIGSGSAKAAARKDDAINDSTDTISGGSTKVKIA